jgi:hypothetical protein
VILTPPKSKDRTSSAKRTRQGNPPCRDVVGATGSELANSCAFLSFLSKNSKAFASRPTKFKPGKVLKAELSIGTGGLGSF